jgi:hypothetical protein
MPLTREQALKQARGDAAIRTGVSESDVKEVSVEETEFPDMALGAATRGEMSGMMMTSGWRFLLSANGKSLEYRANPDQVRLYGYQGKNYRL